MDITPYVEALRRDLVAAAESGGESARAAAERLAMALDPALRLALFEALSHAAAEITQDLPAGSVEVRLKGREPQFVVDVPPPAPEPQSTPAEEDDVDLTEDLGAPLARLTLRLPESLKARAEDAASRRGQSLNSWLVNAVRSALRDRAIDIDIDLSSLPFGPGGGPFGPSAGRRKPGKRISGWVR